MRKLLLTTLGLVLVFAARPAPARADVGLGLFLGEPTGLDLKIGLSDRSGLDLLFGYDDFHGNQTYGHVTYLVTPVFAQGGSVVVPLRVGIGAALFGTRRDISFAARAPLELALRLRHTPLEFYGELALAVVLVDPNNDLHIDLQGGGGFRVFF